MLEKSTEDGEATNGATGCELSSREELPGDGNKELVGDSGGSSEDERFLFVEG